MHEIYKTHKIQDQWAWFVALLVFIYGCFWLPTVNAQDTTRVGGYKTVGKTDGKKIAHQRIALVIGNTEYLKNPLQNPRNDAADMAKKLRELGFTVTEKYDLNHQELKNSILDFRKQITQRQAGDVALFYYSGHGIQYQGENYLVPIDAVLDDAKTLSLEAINIDTVLQGMFNEQGASNIVILDACRDHPFIQNDASTVGSKGTAGANRSSRGIAAHETTIDNTYIAYATSPNQVASDNPTGRNGLYTNELLHALDMPGLSIEEIFRETRKAVKEKSGGKQIPWESSSLTEKLVLSPNGITEPTTDTTQKTPNKTPDKTPDKAPTFEELLQQCHKNDANACLAVSKEYKNEKNPIFDMINSALYSQKACELGSADACIVLGNLYQAGKGVAADPNKAVGLYERACNLGSVYICYALADRYQQGKDLKKDPQKARELLQKIIAPAQDACERQDWNQCFYLGWLYSTGEVVEKDPLRALQIFRVTCENGITEGCSSAGTMYHDGTGIEANPKQALPFWERACEGGATVGCRMAGIAYAKGELVAEDPKRAVSLLQRACLDGKTETSDPEACGLLAAVYDETEFSEQAAADLGIRSDIDKAIALWEFACLHGQKAYCESAVVTYLEKFNKIQASNTLDQAATLQLISQLASQSLPTARESCAMGLAQGCFLLGISYQNESKALSIYEKTCEMEKSEETHGKDEVLAKAESCYLAALLYAKKAQAQKSPAPQSSVFEETDATKFQKYVGKACKFGSANGCMAVVDVCRKKNDQTCTRKALERACELQHPTACQMLK